MEGKMKEIKPGMYLLDNKKPSKEKMIESMDELIEALPKHRKFLEKVKKNILKNCDD